MKGYSTRHALLRLVETCKQCLDNNDVVGMALTELSRTYDCFNYGLLLAKLHAYDFSRSSLRMIYTMSAKSLGTLPVFYAVDKQQNPLPRKTMLFEGDTNSTGGRNDVSPSS